MVRSAAHNGSRTNPPDVVLIHRPLHSGSTPRRLRVRPSQVFLLCSALALLAIYLGVDHWRPIAAGLLPLNVLALWFNRPIALPWEDGGSWRWS